MEVVYVKREKDMKEEIVEDQFLEISTNSISSKDRSLASNKMKKQMSPEETALLVELIQANTTIISKELNAATNRLKEEAWARLTATFNEQNDRLRSQNNLKSKWDNLKKAARKRSHLKQLESIKSDGGKSMPTTTTEEILDKVEKLLRCAYERPVIGGNVINTEEVMDGFAYSEDISSTCTAARVSTSSDNSNCGNFINDISAANCLIAPRSRMLRHMMARQKKGKRSIHDDGRRELNLSMAAYYRAKTKKLQLECEILKKQLY